LVYDCELVFYVVVLALALVAHFFVVVVLTDHYFAVYVEVYFDSGLVYFDSGFVVCAVESVFPCPPYYF
jgi:hypothetical protein